MTWLLQNQSPFACDCEYIFRTTCRPYIAKLNLLVIEICAAGGVVGWVIGDCSSIGK